jgi:hypothetical protein
MSNWKNEFKNPIDFITLESAITDFLLQEDGFKLILEQTGQSTSLWTNQTKN